MEGGTPDSAVASLQSPTSPVLQAPLPSSGDRINPVRLRKGRRSTHHSCRETTFFPKGMSPEILRAGSLQDDEAEIDSRVRMETLPDPPSCSPSVPQRPRRAETSEYRQTQQIPSPVGEILNRPSEAFLPSPRHSDEDENDGEGSQSPSFGRTQTASPLLSPMMTRHLPPRPPRRAATEGSASSIQRKANLTTLPASPSISPSDTEAPPASPASFSSSPVSSIPSAPDPLGRLKSPNRLSRMMNKFVNMSKIGMLSKESAMEVVPETENSGNRQSTSSVSSFTAEEHELSLDMDEDSFEATFNNQTHKGNVTSLSDAFSRSSDQSTASRQHRRESVRRSVTYQFMNSYLPKTNSSSSDAMSLADVDHLLDEMQALTHSTPSIAGGHHGRPERLSMKLDVFDSWLDGQDDSLLEGTAYARLYENEEAIQSEQAIMSSSRISPTDVDASFPSSGSGFTSAPAPSSSVRGLSYPSCIPYRDSLSLSEAMSDRVLDEEQVDVIRQSWAACLTASKPVVSPELARLFFQTLFISAPHLEKIVYRDTGLSLFIDEVALLTSLITTLVQTCDKPGMVMAESVRRFGSSCLIYDMDASDIVILGQCWVDTMVDWFGDDMVNVGKRQTWIFLFFVLGAIYPSTPTAEVTHAHERFSARCVSFEDTSAVPDSYRDVAQIVDAIVQPESTFKYSLSEKNMSIIPSGLSKLVNLTSLDLSHNQLSSVPSKLVTLSQLVTLRLDFNQFWLFPVIVCRFKKLSKLSLSHNAIENVPNFCGDVVALRSWLISSIIGNLRRLRKLNLSHNELTDLFPAVCYLTELTELNLSNNKVSKRLCKMSSGMKRKCTFLGAVSHYRNSIQLKEHPRDKDIIIPPSVSVKIDGNPILAKGSKRTITNILRNQFSSRRTPSSTDVSAADETHGQSMGDGPLQVKLSLLGPPSANKLNLLSLLCGQQTATESFDQAQFPEDSLLLSTWRRGKRLVFNCICYQGDELSHPLRDMQFNPLRYRKGEFGMLSPRGTGAAVHQTSHILLFVFNGEEARQFMLQHWLTTCFVTSTVRRNGRPWLRTGLSLGLISVGGGADALQFSASQALDMAMSVGFEKDDIPICSDVSWRKPQTIAKLRRDLTALAEGQAVTASSRVAITIGNRSEAPMVDRNVRRVGDAMQWARTMFSPPICTLSEFMDLCTPFSVVAQERKENSTQSPLRGGGGGTLLSPSGQRKGSKGLIGDVSRKISKGEASARSKPEHASSSGGGAVSSPSIVPPLNLSRFNESSSSTARVEGEEDMMRPSSTSPTGNKLSSDGLASPRKHADSPTLARIQKHIAGPIIRRKESSGSKKSDLSPYPRTPSNSSLSPTSPRKSSFSPISPRRCSNSSSSSHSITPTSPRKHSNSSNKSLSPTSPRGNNSEDIAVDPSSMNTTFYRSQRPSEEEGMFIAARLHRQGVVSMLDMQQSRANQYIILDPSWITSMVAKALSYFLSCPFQDGLIHVNDFLEHVWFDQPEGIRQCVVSVLEEFDLVYSIGTEMILVSSLIPSHPTQCERPARSFHKLSSSSFSSFPPPPRNENDNNGSSRNISNDDNDDNNNSEQQVLWTTAEEEERVRTIRRQIFLRFFPVSLPARLIARLLSLAPLKESSWWSSGFRWNMGEKGKILVLFPPPQPGKVGRISIRVHCEGASAILHSLTTAITSLLDGAMPSCKYRIAIPCALCSRSDNPYVGCPLFFDVHDVEAALVQGKQIQCGDRMIDHSVLAPDLAMYGFPSFSMGDVLRNDISQLAVGSDSVLFLGSWKGKRVVMKVYDPSSVEDFLRGKNALILAATTSDDFNRRLQCRRQLRQEAWIMRWCEHPNIVQVFAVNPCEGSLLMEYCAMGDLYRFLHSEECEFSWRFMVSLIRDVCEAIDCLHSRTPSLLHRDIKSPNILIVSLDPDAPVVAKLADFGIASSVCTAEVADIPDNPDWVANEVLDGRPCSTKSDIFSVGIVLWEMVTRCHPYSDFRFAFSHQKSNAIINNTRPIVPLETPLPFAQLIRRCWDPNPAVRPEAAELAAHMRSLESVSWADYPSPQEVAASGQPKA